MAESNYIKAIGDYRNSLVNALEIANDPFKAPEQVVMTSKDVMAAAWNMQTEYAAMKREAPQELPAYTLLLEIRKLVKEESDSGFSAVSLSKLDALVEEFFGD
jgi:hypothetical protein